MDNFPSPKSSAASPFVPPMPNGSQFSLTAIPWERRSRSIFGSGLTPRVFIGLMIACQLVLLSGAGAIAELRPYVRTAAFAASLVLLFLVRGKTSAGAHPASKAALIILLIVGISIFRPDTSTLTAGIAHAAMYAAILSPLFWMRRI